MVKLKIFSLLFLIFTFIISCSPDMIQTTELSEDEKQKNISDQQKQKIENDAVEILFSSATESTETLKEGPKTTGTLKEGPKTTGALKEGPKTTGALKEGPKTTGSLKTTNMNMLQKTMFITYLKGEAEYPLQIKDISTVEFFSFSENDLIKSTDILKIDNLSIKSVAPVTTKPLSQTSPTPTGLNPLENDNPEKTEGEGHFAQEIKIPNFKILTDNAGNFILMINSDIENFIIRITLQNSSSIAIIPQVLGNIDLKLIIDEDSTTYGGTKKPGKILDFSNNCFVVKNISDKYIFEILKNDKKEIYTIKLSENNFMKANLIPTKSELIKNIEVEKKNLFKKLIKPSKINNYLGKWKYKNITGEDYILSITDNEKNKFSAETTINGIKYQGDGKYSDSENKFLILESKINNIKVLFRLEFLGLNTLNLKIEDILAQEYKDFKGYNFSLVKTED